MHQQMPLPWSVRANFELWRTADLLTKIGKFLHVISASDADSQIRESEHVIFEGAQGVLLDEWLGFHPHTTWSTTTTANADAMIAETGRTGPVERIGVVRAYATRHGQGPFPTEDAALTEQLRDTHNTDTGPQGSFRVGWFDVPLTKYALSACPGITSLAVTCLDRLANVPEWSVCEAYEGGDRLVVNHGHDLAYQEQLTHYLMGCTPVLRGVPSDVQGYVREIEQCTGLPVSVISLGPTAEDKRWI
jgi:adenylosuccinate synthase